MYYLLMWLMLEELIDQTFSAITIVSLMKTTIWPQMERWQDYTATTVNRSPGFCCGFVAVTTMARRSPIRL
jgi:hypothetical protein